MPTTLDLAFLFFIFVVIAAVEGLVFFPRFRAEVARGVPNTRTKAYRRTIAGQWAFTLAVIAIWAAAGRSWSALGLIPAGGVRLIAGIVLIALMVWFGIRQTRAIGRLAAKPDRHAAIRDKLGGVGFMLPHTRAECRWFTALSLTAGICEEILCRGYLMWALSAYMNSALAVAASVLLFGLGHLYQGVRGAAKSAAAGLVMNLVVLGTGWLIPAMVIHALVDMTSGLLGFAVLRDDSLDGSADVARSAA